MDVVVEALLMIVRLHLIIGGVMVWICLVDGYFHSTRMDYLERLLFAFILATVGPILMVFEVWKQNRA